MKFQQKLSENKKNVLRGPRVIKKMKTPKKKIIGSIEEKKTPLLTQAVDGNTIKTEMTKLNTVLNRKLNAKPVNSACTDGSKLVKLDISSKMINQAVTALMNLQKEHKAQSKTTILNEKDFVYLQLNWIRKPEVPEQRRKYVKLHHGVFGDDPEVCLLVQDFKPWDHIKRTPDERIELTIEHYQEQLKLNQVQGIATIMPLFQLKSEYDSYELKRKLVDRFDIFLCQSQLLDNEKFLKKLGIAFTRKNKVPLSVKLPKDPKTPDPKFANRVATALSRSWYVQKPDSHSVAIRIGTTSHLPQQLQENILHVLYQLTDGATADDGVPGGVANIKSIMLKSSRSKPVPLYVSLAPVSSVPIPVLKSVHGEFDAEEDELSTQPGKRVCVTPAGDVFVMQDDQNRPFAGWDSDEDDENMDEEEEEEPAEASSDDDVKKPVKKQKVKKPTQAKKKAQRKTENNSDSEDEHVEAVEKKYLEVWSQNDTQRGSKRKEQSKKAAKENQKVQKKALEDGKKKGRKTKREKTGVADDDDGVDTKPPTKKLKTEKRKNAKVATQKKSVKDDIDSENEMAELAERRYLGAMSHNEKRSKVQSKMGNKKMALEKNIINGQKKVADKGKQQKLSKLSPKTKTKNGKTPASKTSNKKNKSK